MKRFVLVAIFLLVGAVNAFGQSTTVSGTVTDAGAQAWAGGSYQFQFVPNPQFPVGPYTWTGGALTNVISGTLDGSGHYSQSVPSNSAISPVGSKWILQVTPNATSSSFSTAPTSITGGTQTLNVTPPAITVTVSTSVSGPLPRAYADAEISPGAIVGTEYYNTTSATIRVCQAVTGQSCTTWAAVGTGAGGPPTGPAGGDLSGTYPNPTVAQVNGGVVPTSAAVVGTNGSKQIVSAPLPTVTTGFIPKAGADTTLANTIVNSLCDEGITTANTLTCADTAGIVSPLFSGSFKNNQFSTDIAFAGGTIPTTTFGSVIFNLTPTTFTYNGCGAPGVNDGQRVTFYNFGGGNYSVANATPGTNTFAVPDFGQADKITFIGGTNGGEGVQFECRGGTLFYIGGRGFIPSLNGSANGEFIVGANGVAGALLGLQGATSGECDLTPNATGTSLASSCPLTGGAITGTVGTPAVYTATNAIGSSPLFLDTKQFGTVQLALTAAGANEPAWASTGGPSDIPAGSRIANFNTPTLSAQTSGSHILDFRFGGTVDFIQNPLFDNLTNVWSAREEITNWNQNLGNASSSPSSGVNNAMGRSYQSNFLSGTQNINQPSNYTNKTNIGTLFITQNTWSAAQDNVVTIVNNKNGTGDALPLFLTSIDYGASSAGSDEGLEAVDMNISDGFVDMEGTVTGSPAAGATSLTVTPTQGSGTQGVERFLLDLTQGTNAGTITSFSGSGLVTVTGSGTAFGTSAAHTTTTAAITVTGSNTTPGSVNVAVSSSTGFATNDIICVASATSKFEYSKITAVPDGTHITAVFAFPHDSGTTFGDGGACGKAISVDADRWISSGGQVGFVTPVGTLYQAWPVIYSTSNTSAVVQIQTGGATDTYSGGGVFPAAAYHIYPATMITSVVNGGATVSSTLTIAPNAITFANGDTIDVETGPSIKHSATGNWQFSSMHGQMGNGAYRGGPVYNGLMTGNSWGWGVTNNTALTQYSGHSGAYTVPLAGFATAGLFGYGLYNQIGPDNAGMYYGCRVNASGAQDCTFTGGGGGVVIAAQNASSSNTGSDIFQYATSSGTEFWKLTFNNQAHTCSFGQTASGISCDGAGTFGTQVVTTQLHMSSETANPSFGQPNAWQWSDSTTHTWLQEANNNTASAFTGTWNATNVTPVTVNANVATDQNLMAVTIPAGALNRVGRSLQISLKGVYSTPAASTSTVTMKVKLCTVSGCGSGTVISPISITTAALGALSVTNDPFYIDATSTTQTAGASAAFEASGKLSIDLLAAATGILSVYGDTNTATVGTIDTTAQLFLQVTIAFSGASASNSATERQLVVQTVN